MTVTLHTYVVREEAILGGEPIVRGTRTPVRAIVELWRQGMPPEEILAALPHLTLAKVYDAMSYFADNADEIMSYIEKNRVPDNAIDPRVRNL